MLVNLKYLLNDAKQNNYAVGAFNVPTLQNVRAVISAAEELEVPVILQHAQVHEEFISIEEVAPILLDYAHRAKVPVAVHLDHGADFDMIIKAIRLGFTSVMYDASGKDFKVNLEETREITRIAHAAGVSVEAELGHVFTSEIGGGEGRNIADKASDYEILDEIYTNPKMAEEFVHETGIDCLAIAFGTTHGVYLEEPELDLKRISQVMDKVNIPLVMHGGSGVSKEDYQAAISNGICKINFYTYANKAGGTSVFEYLKNNEKEIYLFDELSPVVEYAMKEEYKNAMKIFSMNT